MTVTSPTTGFAPVNGAQIYYEEAGYGFPLVMAHAGIADLRMWNDQFRFFARRYRVIRYDMRGYGRTAITPGKFANHEDLYGLLRHLNVERAYLMGCSRGGEAVVDLALEHPEMAAALVTVCASLSGFRFEGPPPAGMEEFEAALGRGDTAQAVELGARLWFDGRGRTPEQVDPAARAKMIAMLEPAIGAFATEENHIELQPPAVDRLESLRLPLLAITGEHDFKEFEHLADLLVAAVPGGKKVILANTAHLPNLERPEEFNQIVQSFLEGIEAG